MQTVQQELPPSNFPIDPLGFLFKIHPTAVAVDVQMPQCPKCNKGVLRCEFPENCFFEEL